MGVPKFFRYISERYPCLSELVREQSMPDFDNLYLDMNGIVHNCTHPDDANIHLNISEEDMFKDIFNYIDKLFFLIKPKKLFFMAVDGVAPRAKMNQQRSRRFRSAKDAEIQAAAAKNRGEEIQHERFDSNCITPGTEFMVRLQDALRYYVKSKISTDPLWQNVRIILSGHNCPGEGEHKIMDYIRYLKSKPDFDPNTKHCIYGLDADLIILGLCTHELHFVVLREEVKFTSKQKRKSVEETRFFLLHLGLMREYLKLDFNALKECDENFDIANLIDDWVLMGFMVGNDFIPHLPCLHISNNALPLLYKTYIKVYPELGGNINEHGKLNLPRLEKYFAALAEVEFEKFQENYTDLKYFDGKQTKNGIDEAFDFDVNEITNETQDAELEALIESSRQFLEDDEYDSGDEAKHIIDEFETYKRNYYINKLNQENMSTETTHEQAICYITALQWILDYYYRGVQSWDWYYPHHYAPFICDLKNFKDHKISYEMGKPFLPFEQLLAVLPAASKQLLPSAYRDLMTNPESEVIDFYPSDFKTDLNGKMHEWEAVVLIPFINEKLLLKAMKACEANLTASERERNCHGPMFQYDHTAKSQGNAAAIYSFKPLYNIYCTETPIWSDELLIPTDTSVCIELPNAERTVFFPGFPTMKYLDFNFELKHARIKVFDYPSNNENMILKPQSRKDFNDVLYVAEKYLNQIVFIGWPHLIKAKVVGISNVDKYIDSDGIKDNEPKMFNAHVSCVEEHLNKRMAIEFEDMSVLVHVRLFIGTSYSYGNMGKVITNDIWSTTITAYPAQGVVSEIVVRDDNKKRLTKIEHLYPENSKVFFIGKPYFGSEGTILDPMLVYDCGRLKVNITVLPDPDFTAAKEVQYEMERNYVSAYEAATEIGISTKCLQRITGTVFVIAGAKRLDLPNNVPKLNIGLLLKYPKQREERSGYLRYINNQWYFSNRAIELVHAYYERYPVVFDYLSKTGDRVEYCFEEDLFPQQVGEKRVEEICAWIKAQDQTKCDLIPTGSRMAEMEAIPKVIDAIEELKNLPVKNVKLQVKPHLLLKPDVTLPDMYKSRAQIKLFDRVVIVKTTYMVPLGAKGTVIGIYPVVDPNPVRLECVNAVENFCEILFDKMLPNGHSVFGLAAERVYKVPESCLLLIYSQEPKTNDLIKMNNNSQNVTTNVSQKSNANVPAPSTNQVEVNANTQSSSSSSSKASAKNEKSVSLATKEEQKNATEPQPQQKIQSDFWMPAANAKVMHKEQQQITQTPPVTIMQKPQPASVAHPVDQTQVLKSLLGINLNDDTKAVSSTPPRLDQPKNFPQPPTCWRNDAQNATQQQRLKQQTQEQQLPMNWRSDVQSAQRRHMPKEHGPQQLPMNWRGAHNQAQMPLIQQPFTHYYNDPTNAYHLNQKLQKLQQHLQQTTSHLHAGPMPNNLPQPSFYLPPQAPKQLHTSPNQYHNAQIPMDQNQKSAFIPLQVMRKKTDNNKYAPTGAHDQLQPPASQMRLNTETNKQNTQDIGGVSNQPNTSAKAMPATSKKNKKVGRMPRIGAKFDVAF